MKRSLRQALTGAAPLRWHCTQANSMLAVYCPPAPANPFFPVLGQAKQKLHGNAIPSLRLSGL